MVLPNPEWEPLGDYSAYVFVHKDNGRLYWNEIVNQYLGHPDSVMLEYDDELNWIGIRKDNFLSVVEDEDGNFYIDAKEALEEAGLVFPLAAHMEFEPEPPNSNLNRVILELE